MHNDKDNELIESIDSINLILNILEDTTPDKKSDIINFLQKESSHVGFSSQCNFIIKEFEEIIPNIAPSKKFNLIKYCFERDKNNLYTLTTPFDEIKNKKILINTINNLEEFDSKLYAQYDLLSQTDINDSKEVIFPNNYSQNIENDLKNFPLLESNYSLSQLNLLIKDAIENPSLQFQTSIEVETIKNNQKSK